MESSPVNILEWHEGSEEEQSDFVLRSASGSRVAMPDNIKPLMLKDSREFKGKGEDLREG